MNRDNKNQSSAAASKPWGGRFSQGTAQLLEAFTASVDFDRRLYRYDIQGSIAHTAALEKAGLLSEDETIKIISGLEQILDEIESGDWEWSQALEDVHMNIEARLIEIVGDVGKKLHTGRSRNDQVVTDLRLYVRDELDALHTLVGKLQETLVRVAEDETDTVMPGCTHLQIAQPVSFAHHLLAWFEMLKRDRERIANAYWRTNVLPLGSAALAGTGFAIDRQYTAELLNFAEVSQNSLDAVSDRDFAIETCAACAMLMMHLSRMAEELVLWTSQAFGFVELPDAYCTGSSMMPQKKNPDGAELIRGKSARVYGDLTALLTLMKGQPLAYNRDNQEDKEPLFDALDTSKACLLVMEGIVSVLTVNRERLAQAAEQGYATATDLADYLVLKNIPFRTAHELTGKIVALAVSKQVALDELSLDDLQSIAPELDDDVYKVLKPASALAARNSYGGTAPEQVRAQIDCAKAYLKKENE